MHLNAYVCQIKELGFSKFLKACSVRILRNRGEYQADLVSTFKYDVLLEGGLRDPDPLVVVKNLLARLEEYEEFDPEFYNFDGEIALREYESLQEDSDSE